MKIRVLETVA